MPAMILGHLAIAGIAKQTLCRKRNLAFLTVAAFLPDLVDKPASMFLGLPGRGIAHTLIVFVSVGVAVWLVGPRLGFSRPVVGSGMTMWLTHLVGDFLEWRILLWPLLGPLEPTPRFAFLEKLYQFYVLRTWPEQFWLEVACIAVALCLLFVHSLLSRGTRPRA